MLKLLPQSHVGSRQTCWDPKPFVKTSPDTSLKLKLLLLLLVLEKIKTWKNVNLGAVELQHD